MNPLVPNWVVPLTTMVCLVGCQCGKSNCDRDCVTPPMPLGTLSDPIWKTHESNAEASDFVIPEHEWVANTESLNDAGISHLMRIIARVHQTPFPVVIEPSSQSVREMTEHKLPNHSDIKLDLRRRDLIVEILMRRGIADAPSRVQVGPATAPGLESSVGGGDVNGPGGRGGLGVGGGGGSGGGGGFGGGGVF